MHFVYVIATADRSRAKIGVSQDPSKRLKSIQISSPGEVFLHAVFPHSDRKAARFTESAVHRVESKHHCHGEWFALAPEAAVQTVEMSLFMQGGCGL